MKSSRNRRNLDGSLIKGKSAKSPRGLKQDLPQLAVYILCDDSTGYEEEDFATEADTMIKRVYENDLAED